MTKEDIKFVTKDLCSRLPYGVDIVTEDGYVGYIIGIGNLEQGEFEIDIRERSNNKGKSYPCFMCVTQFKPFLRSILKMTKQEREELQKAIDRDYFDLIKPQWDKPIVTESGDIISPPTYYENDWLNENGFDYRGLIDRGWAIEVDELCDLKLD